MAIAFDAASEGSVVDNTTLTISHTTAGSNRALFFAVDVDKSSGDADVITGVTYNGVAMTRIGIAAAQANSKVSLYVLNNPTIGTNDIVTTLSAAPATTTCRGVGMSYSEVHQGAIDSSATGNNSGTTITATTTVVGTGCWLVGAFYGNAGGLAASTDTTERGDETNLTGDDSNAIVAAGSRSLVVTCNSDNFAWVVASFSPFVPTTGRSQFYFL